jgi:ribonuclease J
MNGVLIVAVTLDKKNKLAADVEVRGIGLPGDAEYPLTEAYEDLAEDAEDALEKLSAEARSDDKSVQQAVGRTLKKTAQRIWERRPVVETVVVRL